MTGPSSETRLIVPALGPLYAKLARWSYPLIRAATGLMLMPHGAQKLFGWFGGYGLEGTGGYFAQNLGLEPGVLWAALVGGTEFFGGLCLALGFQSRPAALGVTILMTVAILTVHLPNGFFWGQGGYEYPRFWGLVALGFVLHGGGALSVDARIGREF